MSDGGKWGGLILTLAALSGSAAAQEAISVTGGRWRDGCAPPVVPSPPCQAVPPSPYWPAAPSPGAVTPTPPTTPTPPAPTTPTTPTTIPEAAPNLQLGSELQGTAESATVALSAPSMFGDQFGSRTLRILVPTTPLIIPGQPTTTVAQTFQVVHAATGQVVGFFPSGNNTLSTEVAPLRVGPATFASPLTFTTVQPLGNVPPAVTLLENGTVTSGLQAVSPGQVVRYANGSAVFLNRAEDYEPVTLNYLFTTPGTPDIIIPRQVEVLVPSPGAGGAVGRTKIADDNSPLPRDRFIFDYDYFNNVPLSARGVDVNRFSAGFEKTFFDGRTSIEVRLPFASTLSNVVSTDGSTNTDRTELGDLNLTLKALLYRGPVVNFAAGLGIAVPTADDVRVVNPGGSELLRIKNEEVVLTPYLAYLLTPTDRIFFQNWVAFGFDTNGNPVSANLDPTGPQRIGRLHDQTLCQIDAQLGYWLTRDEGPSALLRGLAPFVELHYNSTLGNPDQLQAPGFLVGAQDAHIDELNLSAGFLALVGERLQLAVGAVVPLKGSNDRTFDWQVGIHGSYFFGPSARDRSRAAGVSGF